MLYYNQGKGVKNSKRGEMTMMYFVEYGSHYEEFENYYDAEIYCGERGISCENIYEMD
jgi:hypothetical protein